METWMWVLIAVAAVVLIAVVAWAMTSRRRTSTLQDRFGDEYERTVERSDNRKQAEIDLRDRTRQRDELDIRPLTPAARNRYVEEWLAIQQRFVDQPSGAVNDAESLLTRVMSDRGYPEDFNSHVDVVSVDHPRLVENYRSAHRVRERAGANQATTEDLREAFVHYRGLFEELLADESEDDVVRGETAPDDSKTAPDDASWRDDVLPGEACGRRPSATRLTQGATRAVVGSASSSRRSSPLAASCRMDSPRRRARSR